MILKSKDRYNNHYIWNLNDDFTISKTQINETTYDEMLDVDCLSDMEPLYEFYFLNAIGKPLNESKHNSIYEHGHIIIYLSERGNYGFFVNDDDILIEKIFLNKNLDYIDEF